MISRSLIAAALSLCVASPALAREVPGIIAEAARSAGVPVALAQAVAHVETRHRCGMIGGVGERGPMQVRPSTAHGLGYRGPVAGLSDCRTGAAWGMRYLRLALDRARGDWMHGATLYNAGIGSRRTRSAYGQRVLAAVSAYWRVAGGR
jgi:soluble lytic murein transglycosylase-like protein